MFLWNRSPLLVLLTTLWLWGAAPLPAHAEELQPMPELSQTFDLAGYAGQTDTIKKDLIDIPNISFELSLPKAWTERTTLGQSYGELIRYDGPPVGDVRPYFSLKRINIKRENSARLELLAYLLKQGYVLRAIKEIDDRNIEALYVAVTNEGDSFAVRMRGRIMGPDLVLAEYGVPVNAWEQMRDEQTFAMKSFKFLKDSDAPIEQRMERTFFKSLRFFYPASWVFEGEETPAENKVSVRLGNKNDQGLEAGRIKLTLISTGSLKDTESFKEYQVDLADTLKQIRKNYESRNFQFGAKIDSRKPKLNVPASFSAMDVYQLHLRKSQYDDEKQEAATHELWIAVFKVKDTDRAQPVEKAYVAELYTPSRALDIYLWSINTRAFEIILKSVQ